MFPRWFQSRCINLFFVLLAAQAQVSYAALPKLLKEVEDKYAKAETLTADFDQNSQIAALKQKKKSSGHITVKRPDKIRWETTSPDPNIFVSNGITTWLYTPPFDEEEHGQVIEKKASEMKSRLAEALLSGRFSVAKDMKIKSSGKNRFVLIPKKNTSGDVLKATIEVEPNEKLIKKVTLDHKGGNKTEITLNKIELGTKVKDDVFNFVPPPNTDKVNP